MTEIVLIAHNLRSTHNVGSLLRTAEGLGIRSVYLTGYTPYPIMLGDTRLPHLAHKIDAQIHKTALGAEQMLAIKHDEDINAVIDELHQEGFQIIALEQDKRAIPLTLYTPSQKVAVIVGREVEGIEIEVRNQCDQIVEIPMSGTKESFNVAVAAAMALFQLTFHT